MPLDIEPLVLVCEFTGLIEKIQKRMVMNKGNCDMKDMKKSIIIFIISCALLLIIGIIWLVTKSPQLKEGTSFESTQKVVIGKPAPDAVFTTLNREQKTIKEFRGKKIMLWLIATWCPSCIAGAQVLQENNNQLANLTIITLKTYTNAGFPGPSIEEFAKRYSPDLLSALNWLWGDASFESTKVYNPKNFPDIYFLIDEEGILQDIDGAPAATINKIITFANE